MSRGRAGWEAGWPRLPDSRLPPTLLSVVHTALMAPDPSGRLGLPLQLLLLTCCFAAAWADLLTWLWPSNQTNESTASLVSVPPGGPPVQPTEGTITHVGSQDGPTEQGMASASPEPPLERLEAGQGKASTAPPASAASRTGPDTKEENIAGVGAKILNVALGIRSFVQLWDDTTSTENASKVETLAPATPTDPLTFPGPSSTPQENGTALWLTSGALHSPDTKKTEAGSLPVPTQPPPSPDGPWAMLSVPSVPPKSSGRTRSSVLGGALPWGSLQSSGWPPDLDGKGLLPEAARPGQRHQRPDSLKRTPLLLPLVTGSLGTRAAPSALFPDPPASLSQISLSALPGDSGAWVSHVANSVGPGLLSVFALLGSHRPTPAVQPVRHASSRCLPLPPSLPVCGSLGISRSWLPNHLHHSSGEEVLVAAQAWEGLLRSHCHHFLAWFFCLLMAPPCGPGPLPALPPCRQFCEVLEDACWSRLDGGRLPVTCASLPAQEDGYCVFIGPAAGNSRPTDPTVSFLPFCMSPAGAGMNLTRHLPPTSPVLAFMSRCPSNPQKAGGVRCLLCPGQTEVCRGLHPTLDSVHDEGRRWGEAPARAL